MNIVYGGSFDPVTKALEEIVKKLHEIYKPENIIIIPTPDSYHRKKLTSFNDRFNMLKLIFKNEIILDIEQLGDSYLGTLHTLDLISLKYKDLYFCTGADNLVDIFSWINYDTLLQKYHFIVFGRNQIDLNSFINENLLKYKKNIDVIPFDLNISSTDFKKNHDKNILRDRVYEYIIKHNLYEVNKK